MKKLWIYLCSYARRANPFWQERRYAETLDLLGKTARKLTVAESNAKLASDENAKLRADIKAIANTASRVRYERGGGKLDTYRIVLDIAPHEFNYGALSHEGRDVFAESIGWRIASEIRHARFVRPGDAPTFTPPNYFKGDRP